MFSGGGNKKNCFYTRAMRKIFGRKWQKMGESLFKVGRKWEEMGEYLSKLGENELKLIERENGRKFI